MENLKVQELKIFIGLLLQTRTIKLNTLQDRFLIILRCPYFLRVNAGPSDNRLFRVRPIIDNFNNTMLKIYYPAKELCIDEAG